MWAREAVVRLMMGRGENPSGRSIRFSRPAGSFDEQTNARSRYDLMETIVLLKAASPLSFSWWEDAHTVTPEHDRDYAERQVFTCEAQAIYVCGVHLRPK